MDAAGKITALKEGKTQVWADVTLRNGLGQPVTVATNRIDIEVLAPKKTPPDKPLHRPRFRYGCRHPMTVNGSYTALSKQALLAVSTEAELAAQQKNLNQEQINGYVSRINAAIAQLAAIPSDTPSVSEPPAPDRGLILPSSRDGSDIRTHLAQSAAGALVQVEMNGGTTVPQDVLAAIQKSRISVVLNMGNYQWILRGEDIVSPQTLGLGVEFLASSALYSTALREIPHDGSAIPLRLSYDGPFYSKASLRFFAGINHRNEYANLYYYNPALKKYEFQSAAQVDTDGYITLPFSHASDYAVILSTKSAAKDLSAGAPCMDGARTVMSK